MVTRYNLSDRIEVIYSDVRQQGSVLQSADLVILNNVFEFFCSLDEQAKYNLSCIISFMSGCY